jgi:hypothetical protein
VLTGELLGLLGFNLNLAPVLDLDHHPDTQNALRGRCWGRDPQRVIDYAGHWNRWMRKRRIASCGKHFPACGRALSDPHHDLPTSSATLADLLNEDVIPYTALMPELDAIMLAHIEFPNIDPQFPASLSPRIIRKFLRDHSGSTTISYSPTISTWERSATAMAAGQDAKLAIEAGNDLAMICHDIDTADVAAQAIAELPHAIRDDAWRRIEQFKKPNLVSVTTINDDGSRYFLHPADVTGKWVLARRMVGVILIAIYVLLPWIPINGSPGGVPGCGKPDVPPLRADAGAAGPVGDVLRGSAAGLRAVFHHLAAGADLVRLGLPLHRVSGPCLPPHRALDRR